MGARLLGAAAIAILLAAGIAPARAQNVNRVELDSAPTGSSPTISPIGPDANLSLVFLPKGSGGVGIGVAAPATTLDVAGSVRSSVLLIDGAAGTYRPFIFRTGGVGRWQVSTNNSAESGSNAGSDFYIQRANDAGTWGSIPFFISRSTGYVGISTSTPLSALHVIGAENDGTNAGLRIENGGQIMIIDGNEIDSIGSLNSVNLQNNNNGNVTLANGGGNVGIGRGPTFKLDVAGSIRSNAVFMRGSAIGTLQDAYDAAMAGSPTDSFFMAQVNGTSIGLNNEEMVFAIADGQTNKDDAISFVVMDQNGLAGTAMRILGNRNIGIGTTTPGYALDVAGTARADVLRVGTGTGTEAGDDNVVRPASGNAFLNLKGGHGKSKIVIGNSYISLTAGADAGSDYISFRNGAIDSISKGTEVMRIAGNGNVGIGIGTPAATLDVNGFARLKNNTVAPATCAADIKGSIALTSATRMCLCDGASWKEVNSATVCTW